MGERLTTVEAADIIGITPSLVRKYVREGRLEAERVGEGRRSTFYFEREEVERFAAIPRKIGRPPKDESEE
jgi:excisionase family DNA binding protein